MRILKVTQAYHPFLERGGPAVKVPALARGLARRGHQITVLTADLGLEAAELSPSVSRSRWGWRKVEEGVEAIYLPTHGRYRALTLNPAVASFCQQQLQGFDLAHIYGLYDLLGPAVAFFCRRSGVPYLVEPMGMFRPIARSLRLKRMYHCLLGNRMLARARWVIATAEQEWTDLIEDGVPAAKIVVRRNGVEVPVELPAAGMFRQRWNIPSQAKLVLFLGRLVSIKSPELLVEAFAAWRNHLGHTRAGALVLAGPDEGDGYRQRLETFAARLGLSGAVYFTGPLHGIHKWTAYRDADVFVLPSQNENFGNTAAEAVACGTPVIVTDRCGIAPLVEQRAGLVVPHDREALRAGLTRLLEDDGLQQRLRARCAEVARALSWEQPVEQLQALYAGLVAEGRPG